MITLNFFEKVGLLRAPLFEHLKGRFVA